MKGKSFHFPPEIWELILGKFDEEYLEEFSLLSKQFLSITNSLKKSIELSTKTLPSLLRRFPNLESITFCIRNRDSLDDFFHQISHRRLQCEGLRNLKRLHFEGKTNFLNYDDYIMIADLFPWLEEINFSQSLKDCEFQNLQLKFTALKKVSFGRGQRYDHFPSNVSLVSLVLNCVDLEEIDIEGCTRISEETVAFFMRHCPKLTTLKLRSLPEPFPNSTFSIQNSMAYAQNLHTLCSYSSTITKEVMHSIVEANPPLQKLKIECYRGINNSKLLNLFQVCSSIQHLCLNGNRCISDACVETISQLLPKLRHINLSNCRGLTTKSFFIIAQKCTFLEEIEMSDTKIGEIEFSSTGLQKNEKILYLNLTGNEYLDDLTMRKILLVCPNLQSIEIGRCFRLTKEGVLGILDTCVSLTSLTIHWLDNVLKVFGEYFENRTLGLKVLKAWASTMDNTELFRIGNICPCLEVLFIGYCERVTNIGVIEMVKNCRKLKKIDACSCKNLKLDILGEKCRSISNAHITFSRYGLEIFNYAAMLP